VIANELKRDSGMPSFLRHKLSRCKCLILFGLCLISLTVALRASELSQDSDRQMQPTMFGAGVISTGDMELNAAFAPDGRTLYFTKNAQVPTLDNPRLNTKRRSVVNATSG